MIPVVFITDKNFIMQTTVALTSLVCNKEKSTRYDIYVIAADCNSDLFKKMRMLDLQECTLNIVEVSTKQYADIKQISHIPISCLLKFEICDLIKQYDKLIYLDGDIVVRGDLSGLYLFDLEDSYIAGVPSIEMVYTNKRMINAGVIVFNAKKMRKDNMSSLLVDTRRQLGEKGSMDQQTFNIVMEKSMKFLPYKYNFIPDKLIGRDKKRFSTELINSLYGTSFKSNIEFEKESLIIHYATGFKPWKYTFVPCGNEWYCWYRKSAYGYQKLRRMGLLEAKLERVHEILEKKGIQGLLQVLRNHLDAHLLKRNGGSGENWG